MQVTSKKIKVRELTDGYFNHVALGAVGYHGKLNIRPSYQREFIYTEAQEKEVIHSVIAGFPLNTIYWSVSDDDTYELLDGQQRTLSICRYVDDGYMAPWGGVEKYWHNLTDEQKDVVLDYELDVYLCDGNEEEKLKWFQIINISGERLTQQELLNAIFYGSFVTEAKKHFVRGGLSCPALQTAKDYISGNVERQELLERAIRWVSQDDIQGYMAAHQHDLNADGLWSDFRRIIDWAKELFPGTYKEKKHVDWGKLYWRYGQNTYDIDAITRKVDELMANSEVQAKSGIFRYVLSGEEKYLNLRKFAHSDKRSKWSEQGGKCALCGKEVVYEECEADHIIPWSKGGRTDWDNLQVLCRDCNRTKSGK